MILRKRYEEPAEGIAMATFVPRMLFTNSRAFANPIETEATLEDLIPAVVKKFPTRYKLGLGRQPQQEKSVIVYSQEKVNGEKSIRSNEISLTGKVLNELVVEPRRERVYAADLHVGFTYPCTRHVADVLSALDEKFILLSDTQFQPQIDLRNLDMEKLHWGNQALFLVYGQAKEFTVATIDGMSLRKATYTVAAEHQ